MAGVSPGPREVFEVQRRVPGTQEVSSGGWRRMTVDTSGANDFRPS